jgi:phosphopantothenoylcysteine synthetase/decarboxylase
MRNPALHEQPRHQPATVIPVQRDASILDWLEGTGRLLSREVSDFDYANDEEEITELMTGDDSSFDLDDDDDDSLDLDE